MRCPGLAFPSHAQNAFLGDRQGARRLRQREGKCHAHRLFSLSCWLLTGLAGRTVSPGWMQPFGKEVQPDGAQPPIEGGIAEAARAPSLAQATIHQQINKATERPRQASTTACCTSSPIQGRDIVAVVAQIRTITFEIQRHAAAEVRRASTIPVANRVSGMAREDIDERRSGRPLGQTAEARDHLQQQILADVRALACGEIEIADDAVACTPAANLHQGKVVLDRHRFRAFGLVDR